MGADSKQSALARFGSKLLAEFPGASDLVGKEITKLSRKQNITAADLKQAHARVSSCANADSVADKSAGASPQSHASLANSVKGPEYLWDYISKYELGKNEISLQTETEKAHLKKQKYRQQLEQQMQLNNQRRRWVNQEKDREKEFLRMDLERQAREDAAKQQEHKDSVQRMRAEGKSMMDTIEQREQLKRQSDAITRQQIEDLVRLEKEAGDIREAREREALAERRLQTINHLQQVRDDKISQKMRDAAQDKYLQDVAIAMLDKAEKDRTDAIMSRKKKQEAIAGTIGKSLGDMRAKAAAENEAKMLAQFKKANEAKDRSDREQAELRRYQANVVKKTLQEQMEFRKETMRSEQEVERLQAALFRQRAVEAQEEEDASQLKALLLRQRLGEMYRSEIQRKAQAHPDAYVCPHRIQAELEFNQPKVREMLDSKFATEQELAGFLLPKSVSKEVSQ